MAYWIDGSVCGSFGGSAVVSVCHWLVDRLVVVIRSLGGLVSVR